MHTQAVGQSGSDFNASAQRTLATEIAGLHALSSSLEAGLGESFDKACRIILGIRGRVVVTGMGKSGLVGAKIAATLASTGTPAFFVHPAEAGHGDLGMITADDVVIALSWSGETVELAPIVSYVGRFQIPLISITMSPESMLARHADAALVVPRVVEACPLALAPSSSTTLQMAFGDALAIALLEYRGFKAEDFSVFHPGGKLGAQLMRVESIMWKGAKMPLVPHTAEMRLAILEMSAKGFGIAGVVRGEILIGVVTDGDLRRNLSPELINRRIDEVMSVAPKTIPPDMLAARSLEFMNANGITAVFAADRRGCPVGILHIHDLLRAGVA